MKINEKISITKKALTVKIKKHVRAAFGCIGDESNPLADTLSIGMRCTHYCLESA